ncbi:hypothetical protein HZZ00_38005 (plasmid) [Streptomyces sp. NEAU-sy36]|uniref:hypothetical protein n=1 Tax=unclassified Streptomyces TaxID=2593676 RepID=UPI0015D61D65|nr:MULTISPECIES: hypothetical protein [unclassified Streptomyces]QLJ06826.1 hypothetical protein HZZ00_38005 [Streptomyces sp. NEAU-sy36]
MTQQPGIDESGRIVRAQAPASGISVPAHLGVGADLVHSLDYVVMLQVMFNLASGMQSTPMTVWKQLHGRGIRSAKNAKELVGKNAVYESFARLVDAGYLRRTQLPHPDLPGRKGPVVYETFDNPAWNPDWQARQAGTDPLTETDRKPQVGTLPGTPDPSFGEAGKTAGGNASRNAGSGNDGSGVPGSVNRYVPAGQDASGVPGRGMPLPPHPPEEEDSSSPYPLTGNTRPHPSQTEEGREFLPEEISQAEDFLQQMKRWQAGGATAQKNAPRLLRALRAQGWPKLAELDEEQRSQLEAEIFRNTVGAKSWVRCLPGWIDDLRRYDRVRTRPGAARGADGRERCPDHPGRIRGRCVECAMAVPS